MIFFTLALLWIGAGSVWIAGNLTRSKVPVLLIFPLTIAASLLSLFFVWHSVTAESLGDIVGAPDGFGIIKSGGALGGVWNNPLSYLNSPEIIDFVEVCIRYWAIYTPPAIFLCLLIYIYPSNSDYKKLRLSDAGLALGAILILWLCKSIAFDWSSTDNLYELIARDGEWGWGGGGYLYGLLLLLCINANFIAEVARSSIRKRYAILILSLGAIPVGWWLINQGLEQTIEKYDTVFSGVQFLLGPDRSHLLSQNTLFLRWCFFQSAVVVVLGLGVRLGKDLFLLPRQPERPPKNKHSSLLNSEPSERVQ
jgi:hypothetical protein